MSDLDDSKEKETPTGGEGTSNPTPTAPPPPQAPQGSEQATHDSPTREEFQTLTGTVQQLVDMVASLVPQARDTTPVKTPWYARGKK